MRDALPCVQSRGSVILPTSCKHPACIPVFENLLLAEFVEHTNLQQFTVFCATVVTELKRDIFRHDAAYFYRFVVVAISQLCRQMVENSVSAFLRLTECLIQPFNERIDKIFNDAAAARLNLHFGFHARNQ